MKNRCRLYKVLRESLKGPDCDIAEPYWRFSEGNFFNSRTGRLSFKRQEIEKYFFFVKGKPIQVKTNVRSERLGEILFKLQKIQDQTYNNIEDFIQPNQPLGESLKRGGVIKEGDLREALGFQIRESLLGIFPYFDGEP